MDIFTPRSTPGDQLESGWEPLEWTLTNPGVPDRHLIQALVAGHYTNAFQLASDSLAGRQAGQQAACHGLALAAQQRYRFQGNQPLEDWITCFIHEAIQEATPAPEKPAGRHDLEWSEDPNPATLETVILQDLARLKKSARRKMVVRQGLRTGAVLAAVSLLLWIGGFLQKSNLTGQVKQALRGWQAAIALPPLTLQSTQVEIEQRIRDSASTWTTLWADELTLEYGPAGTSGPPLQTARQQVWLRQRDQGLLLKGILDNPTVYQAIFYTRNTIYHLTVGYLFNTYSLTGSMALVMEKEHLLAFPAQSLPSAWRIIGVGTEKVAGRNALVVDVFDQDGGRKMRCQTPPMGFIRVKVG
jgi:hypothetical protein